MDQARVSRCVAQGEEMNQRTIEQRSIPWLCRIFGHRWRMSHALWSGPEKPQCWQYKDVWVYYAHTCTRCWLEERRSLWPTL